jgi:peroxiredoxin
MKAFLFNQRYSLAVVFALIIITGFGSPIPGFIIKGNIQGASGMAYITYEFNYKDHTDSAIITNGQFTLNGQLPEPLLCTLRVSNSQQIRLFFAENTTMQATGNVAKLFDIQVGGGKEQEIWNGFNTKQREVIGDKIMEVRKRPRDSSSHKLSPADAAEIDVVKDSVMQSFVKANPNAVATAFIIYQTYIVYPDYKRAGELYVLLNKKIKDCYYARRTAQNVHATDKTTPGSLAPAFTLPDTTGQMVSLASFKGQYVLIDFWASWCMPCRKENPYLKKAYNRFHSKGFEIVGVSIDSGKGAWTKAIETDSLPWVHVSDLKAGQGPVPDAYGVKSIPKNVLVDKSGKVIARNLRGEELENLLEKILN